MKLILVLLLASSLKMADLNKWGAEEVEGVSSLNNDNFDEFVKTNNFVFVKFYAPWCGHCKKMAPSYSELARKYNTNDKNIVIAEVDVTKAAELGTKFGVKGYPTLKFFYYGEPMEYSGDREATSIEEWILKKMTTATEEITTAAKLKEVASSKLAVVLYGSILSTTVLNRFKALAGGLEKLTFYTTTLADAKQYTDGTEGDSLIVFRNFDDGKKVLTSQKEFTLTEMKEFVDKVRFSAVLDFDEEAAQTIFGGQKTTVFLFTEDQDSEALKAFTEVANSKKFDLTFSKSTINDGMGKRLSEYIGVTANDNNSIRLVQFQGQDLTKYKLDKISTDSLTKFIQDFEAGKLSAYRKSEKPLENDTEPVKTIVGDNFDDLVINNDKYVLLEVYAPWCGHCKQLVPIYNELATKLAHLKNLVIAKMDGTGNEHPAVAVKGFPTIKFFKKGSKADPVDYEGGRDLEGFLTYLKTEMGSDFTEASGAVSEEL